MSIREDFLKLVRSEEYEQVNAKDVALQEEANITRETIASDIKKGEYPIKKMHYLTNCAKAVIVECVTRLYMKSLIVENADQYAETLKPVARKQLVSCLSEATTRDELYAMLENASPYVKAILPLAESICEKKEEALEAEENKEEKPFDDKVILDKEDMSLIREWEKNNSQDVYAGELQDRVVKVYEDEENASKEQKDKVQAIVDSLSEIDDEPIEEAVNGGINVIENTPKSIFNAIFVNKSRAILTESGEGADIAEHAEDILCETICTYTLLECIHSLGLHTYNDNEKIRLMYDFATK